jgi:hypothetical protein
MALTPPEEAGTPGASTLLLYLPNVKAREKRPQGGRIMSICNVEYKAKERRSKLGNRGGLIPTSLAITCEYHELSRGPWLQSLQSCNSMPLRSLYGQPHGNCCIC